MQPTPRPPLAAAQTGAAPARATSSPYKPNFSRAGNIENAKAAGEFDAIREAYNRDNSARGYTMDEGGVIKQDQAAQQSFARSQLQPAADEIAARRDFARGEAPVQRFDQQGNPVSSTAPQRVGYAQKMNPYGTATATFGAPSTGGGTMPDPLAGKTVAMSPYLAQQRAVQDTKYGPGAAAAGEKYFDQKELAGEPEPLGQKNAEQFRSIARGGVPRRLGRA